MLLGDKGYDIARKCLQEFQQQCYPQEVFDFFRLSDMHPPTGLRQIFRLKSLQHDFVLKFDTNPEFTKSMAHEYTQLSQLSAHFDETPDLCIAKPVYLGNEKNFLITRYIDEIPVNHLTYKEYKPFVFQKIFSSAGKWLDHLHRFTSPESTQFWPAWYFERIEERLNSQDSAEAPWARKPLIRHYMRLLRQEAAALRGRFAERRFAHGDFHGGNLIFFDQKIWGIDLTNACYKLPYYDIVDFIMNMDVQYDLPVHQLGDNGISHTHYNAFFSTYHLLIDHEILDFCLRATLLLSWTNISRHRIETLPKTKEKFNIRKKRIQRAFQPLEQRYDQYIDI